MLVLDWKRLLFTIGLFVGRVRLIVLPFLCSLATMKPVVKILAGQGYISFETLTWNKTNAMHNATYWYLHATIMVWLTFELLAEKLFRAPKKREKSE